MKGGHASYGDALNYTSAGSEYESIKASYFMAYHSVCIKWSCTWFWLRLLFSLLKGKAYNSWRLLFHTSWSHHLFTTSRVKQKASTSITPLLAPETKPSSLNRPWRMWICWKIIQYKCSLKKIDFLLTS